MSNPAASNTARPQQAPGFGQEGLAGASDNLVQFISFAIGDDQYGVDIMAVREIKEWTEITHLPKQPEYVRGVLNLRGVIVPIIDLRCRFGQGLTEATPLHVIIIVQIEHQLVGLLADRVSDIDLDRHRQDQIRAEGRAKRASRLPVRHRHRRKFDDRADRAVQPHLAAGRPRGQALNALNVPFVKSSNAPRRDG